MLNGNLYGKKEEGSARTVDFLRTIIAKVRMMPIAWKEYTNERYHRLPMDKYTSAAAQSISYEGIAGREVLDDIGVFIVIYIDGKMLIILKQCPVQWQSQDG